MRARTRTNQCARACTFACPPLPVAFALTSGYTASSAAHRCNVSRQRTGRSTAVQVACRMSHVASGTLHVPCCISQVPRCMLHGRCRGAAQRWTTCGPSRQGSRAGPARLLQSPCTAQKTRISSPCIEDSCGAVCEHPHACTCVRACVRACGAHCSIVCDLCLSKSDMDGSYCSALRSLSSINSSSVICNVTDVTFAHGSIGSRGPSAAADG